MAQRGPKPLALLDRFRRGLRAGAPSACWLWGRRTDGRGKGHVRIADDAGGRIYVHRLAYELAHGAIPAGLDVLHHCDVPRCCNPAHLFLGTQADNMADKVRKGRQARGEDGIGSSRLTLAQIREIHTLGKTLLQREIAARFGVRRPTISRILNGTRWPHVAAGGAPCP
jgi:hypothetical protein